MTIGVRIIPAWFSLGFVVNYYACSSKNFTFPLHCEINDLLSHEHRLHLFWLM